MKSPLILLILFLHLKVAAGATVVKGFREDESKQKGLLRGSYEEERPMIDTESGEVDKVETSEGTPIIDGLIENGLTIDLPNINIIGGGGNGLIIEVCEDDPLWQKAGGFGNKRCSDLATGFGKAERKCENWVGSDGTTAIEGCKKTCGNCN